MEETNDEQHSRECNAISRLRRIARRHDLRVLTHQNGNGYQYRLQAAVLVLDSWVSIEELTTVCENLYCAEVSR